MHRKDEISGNPSRLSNVASTFRVVAKRLGWPHTLLWSCASLGRRFSTYFFVVTIHSIDDDEARTSPETAGLEGRLLSRDDVMRFFNRAEGYSYSRPFAVEALSRGDRCFGLFEGDALLWYCWYAREAAPVFDDLDVVAEFPFIYAYNAYTDSAFRGRGLHRVGVEQSARFFAREGYRGITAYIEAHNVAPLIAARNMGERFVGFAAVHQTAGRSRWLATRGCRKAAFRLQRRLVEATLGRPAHENRRAS